MSESLWNECVKACDEIAKVAKRFVEYYNEKKEEATQVGSVLKFVTELKEVTEKYPRLFKKDY